VPKRDPAAATLGVLSVALLGASFVWAHHWGILADTLVATWVVATIGALVLASRSLWLLDSSPFARRLAKIGLCGGVVSLAALALAGIVYAAGINPTGACGGG
jgi:hypothetical protein